MSTKPITPYARLLGMACDWVCEVRNRRRTLMFTYSADKIETRVPWLLYDLLERVRGAQQLGYTVELRADKDGLHVEYVAPLPPNPHWY